MSNSILEKREALRNEKITMTRAVYQMKMGKIYNMGQINALTKIGKGPQEIATILGLNEATVRSISNI